MRAGHPIQQVSLAIKSVSLANGETYTYRECGSGRQVLLLVHGNLSSSILWDVLMQGLPQHHYRVLAPDLRGFGDSTYLSPIHSIGDLSKDLLAFMDALGISQAAVMGWSMGGLVALQFAAHHPQRISHLMLMGASAYALPSPKLDGEGKAIPGAFWSSREDMVVKYAGIRKILEERDAEGLRKGLDFAVYLLNKPEPARYKAYIQEIFKQRNKLDVDDATVRFNISNQHNGITQGTGDIDLITCPVLVFQGDRDIVVPPSYGRDLAAWIGQNARLCMLENTSHSPLVDSLETVIQQVNDFVLSTPDQKAKGGRNNDGL